MLLATYAAAALALALATPPPQLTIQYTWSKSGFVVLTAAYTAATNCDG